MNLEIPTSRQPPSRWPEHLLLWGVSLGTLVLFGASEGDFHRGKSDVGDAIPFTVAFLATAYFFARLPRIWRSAEGTLLAGLVLPCFGGLVLAYFVLGCRAGFIQPGVTAVAVLAQTISFVLIGARTGD